MLKENKQFTRILLLVWILVPMITKDVKAMHIMEGYLPFKWSFIYNILTYPFLILGYRSIKAKTKMDTNTIVVYAMAIAYVFVISALKLPSVTGSSSHATGIALGAILLGPAAMSIVSVIVLLFQAILLAHGGITTLGANVLAMGIVGAYSAYYIYKTLIKANVSNTKAIFIATFTSNLLTYGATSIQLTLAYSTLDTFAPTLIKFISVFALTQVPLAIIEGIVTMLVLEILQKQSSIKQLLKGDNYETNI